jgi:hypothetical protein
MKLTRLAIVCIVLTAIVASAAQAEEFLYALSNYINGSLLKVEPGTWTVLESHPITNDEALFGGLAVDAAQDIYSIDGYNDANSDRLFRIDRSSGAGTVVGDTGFNWNFRFVYAHPITDVLYGGRDSELYTIDRASGLATLIGSMSGVSGQISALAIDSQGNAYCTSLGNTGLYSLDLSNAQATYIGNIGPDSGYQDLAFDSNDVLYGVHFFDNGTLWTIDTVNATETFVAATSYRGITFVVEEPECPGDVDGDGDTDLSDLATLLSAYGSVPGDPNWNPACDFDADSDVDLTDLAFLLSDYGCGG